MSRTKIICTIGPASEKINILLKMAAAGMKIARLNFSHGNYEHHKLLIENLRKVGAAIKAPIGILADLQGPKIRVSSLLKKPIKINEKQKVILVDEKIWQNTKKLSREYIVIPLQRDISFELKKGDRVFISEGLIKIKMTSKNTGEVETGGIISLNSSVNIPGHLFPNTPSITQKDKQDLVFALKNKVDFVALSFVRSKKDIEILKKLIAAHSKVENKPLVIAKIETSEAVDNLEEVINVSDGIMVARGDLGVELPQEEVPLVQKKIIELCLKIYNPVIVATQMLDSMIKNPRPTRAEVSDVAGAVIDHADALMLSGETAFGKYPVESVKTMQSIIRETEASPYDDVRPVSRPGLTDGRARYLRSMISRSFERPGLETGLGDLAPAHAARELANEVQAKLILVASLSGSTARIVSSLRPQTQIVVTAENPEVQRQLLLSWGITPYVLPRCRTVDELISKGVEKVKREKLIKKGDKIVILAGQPVGKRGANLVKVHTI